MYVLMSATRVVKKVVHWFLFDEYYFNHNVSIINIGFATLSINNYCAQPY